MTNTDRLKFRFFDAKNEKYIDNSEIELLVNHNGTLLIGNFVGAVEFAPKDYIVEQSIGVKDIFGNLIYEGDVCVDKLGNIRTVKYIASQRFGFALVHTNPEIPPIFSPAQWWCNSVQLKIISNIHEYKGGI